MAQNQIDLEFRRIETIRNGILEYVPEENIKAVEFRANLAGLLVVATVASYENCVKLILTNYAGVTLKTLGRYVDMQYKKLNSRIRINNLKEYANLFSEGIHSDFKDKLEESRKAEKDKSGADIVGQYHQILEWRHDYAHSGLKNTTVNEAFHFHQNARRVIDCFASAFRD